MCRRLKKSHTRLESPVPLFNLKVEQFTLFGTTQVDLNEYSPLSSTPKARAAIPPVSMEIRSITRQTMQAQCICTRQGNLTNYSQVFREGGSSQPQSGNHKKTAIPERLYRVVFLPAATKPQASAVCRSLPHVTRCSVSPI